MGKSSKLAVESDRNSKSPRNVQNLTFTKKNRWVFPEKTWNFENR